MRRRAGEPRLVAWQRSTPSAPAACASATATWRPSAASTSTSTAARSSPCSAPTAPARPPRWRSSRATAAATRGEVGVLGADPARAGRALARPDRHRAAAGQRRGRELTVARWSGTSPRYYPAPARPDEVIDAGRPGRARRRRRVRQLSGGQRRRLDVALGIVGRPELLFLDEPTTGFDPEARRAVLGPDPRPAGDGTTILLTTHYLDEAEALADRVAVIAGRPHRRRGRRRRRSAAGPARRRPGRWLDATARAAPSRPTRRPAWSPSWRRSFGGEVPGLTVTGPRWRTSTSTDRRPAGDEQP